MAGRGKAPPSPLALLNDDDAERKRAAESKAKARRQSGASSSSRGRLSVGSNGGGGGGAGMSVRSTKISFNALPGQSGIGSQQEMGSIGAGTAAAGSAGGRLDMAIGLALTNEQLTDMYANIIRLSAENKINAKNAFDLDLINNARDVIAAQTGQNAGGHAGTTNFQAASHTLDAAMKIYCARLDIVHTDTTNFRGGLQNVQLDDGAEDFGLGGEDEAGAADDDDDDDDAKKAPKRRARATASTLAQPAAITSKEIEADFEPDPLFKQMQKVFDASGASGLLLNHLTVRRGCELVFDSRDRVGCAQKRSSGGKQAKNSENMEVESLSSSLGTPITLCAHDDHAPIDMARLLKKSRFGPSVLDLQICPKYSAYEAAAVAKMANLRRVIESRGGIGMTDMSTNMSVAKTPAKKGKRSVSTDGGNMLAPYSDDDSDGDGEGAEHNHGGGSLPSLTNLVGALGDSESPAADEDGLDLAAAADADMAPPEEDFFDGMGGDGGFDDSDAEDLYGGDHEGGGLLDDAEFAAAMNAEQSMLADVDEFAGDTMAAANPIQDARDITDVFNVDTAMLTSGSNWAGLSHWKFKQPRRSARATATGTTDATSGADAGATKARKRKEPFFIDFSEAGAIDEEKLFAPPGRKATTLSDAALKKLEADAALNTELPPDVHYDAKMLTQLFLKPQWRVALRGGGLLQSGMATADHGARVAHDGFDSDDGGGFDDGGGYDYDMDNGFDDDDGDDTGHGGRLQLVARPKTVGDVGINYAKHAKMVDVKALKESMWNSLTTALPTQPRPQAQDDEDSSMEDASQPHEETTFQEIISELPKTVPQQMLPDVSVSYCFICLLHLANEQQLEINDTPTLDELRIKRSRPSGIANE